MINVYCDESCHLENDKSNFMVLGAISCIKGITPQISKELRAIKRKHLLSPTYELKWTKVSNGKISYYKELVEYFYDNESLSFRAVVADKTKLRHNAYSQTHEEWYYKMCHLLLKYAVDVRVANKIYIDYKDTQCQKRVSRLEDILRHRFHDFPGHLVGIQQINSKESELMQLADFLIGTASYANRSLSSSACKIEICKYIEKICNVSLTQSTPLEHNKFNLLLWRGK
jgi:hypothetical protein